MAKKLTRAEEEIMLVLWELEEATIRDIMRKLGDRDTPYTTISTVVRVLEKKGFVGHKPVGTTYLYHPLVKKEDYLKGFLSGIVTKYFDGSFTRLAAFFARENNLKLSELTRLLEEIENGQKMEEDNG